MNGSGPRAVVDTMLVNSNTERQLTVSLRFPKSCRKCIRSRLDFYNTVELSTRSTTTCFCESYRKYFELQLVYTLGGKQRTPHPRTTYLRNLSRQHYIAESALELPVRKSHRSIRPLNPRYDSHTMSVAGWSQFSGKRFNVFSVATDFAICSTPIPQHIFIYYIKFQSQIIASM